MKKHQTKSKQRNDLRFGSLLRFIIVHEDRRLGSPVKGGPVKCDKRVNSAPRLISFRKDRQGFS
jgi:hypothetical protein